MLFISSQNLTNDTLEVIVEGARKLEEVALISVYPIVDFSVLSKLPLLTKLSVRAMITPDALEAISVNGRLESLDVSNRGDPIHENTLIKVVENGKNLTTLESGYTIFSDAFVIALNAEMERRHGDREPTEEEILAGCRLKIKIRKSLFSEVSVPVSPWIVINIIAN